MNRLLVLAGAVCLAVTAAAAVPPVLVPPHADSVSTSEPPAPFLRPGRGNPSDSLRKTPRQLALEQFALGSAFERQGQPMSAIAAYRNAVRLDPQLPEAHYRMGRLFSAVQQHAVAAREYASELDVQPDHREAQRWLGVELAQSGDTTAAVTQLERLTQRDPGDEAAWQALGFVYGSMGRARQAEAALKRALALDPRDADAWRDLGTLLAASRRAEEARRAYGKAAALDPRDAGVWVNLGNLERREGRWKPALDAYAHALERDSTQALAWRGRVATYEAQQRPEEAARTLREWLRRTPLNTSLRMEAMERWAALGRRDIALELARDGVRQAPKSGEAHLALGMALHESGNERASLAELRRAQDLLSQAGQRARVGGLIATMRAQAPDSLRAVFAADSVAYESAAPDRTAH
jgi:tetratricopeptide (TPR) repeat protein